jgi:UDP-N-acetylmuramoyl-tripeptide--D-alanyl-D-alanine ligase
MNRSVQSGNILATAARVAKATAGKLVAGDPQTICVAVGTDSRTPLDDSLFVALSGENFDGADFCAGAVSNGARIVVVTHPAWSRGLPGDLQRAAVVAVDDTLRALGDLAAWHRSTFPVRMVGITGSNGKTSTKEMTAAVLGGAPGVLSNQGNLNNLVGMPRSLLSLGAEHHHAVMEMGMNHPGEIERLAQIARPQIGVLTNVHPVHLEGLGSIQAVAEAKGELLEALPGEGVAVLNADDPYVLKQAARTRARRVTFGRSPGAEVRVVAARQDAESMNVELEIPDGSLKVRIDRPGLHNALNAAAAAAVGLVAGIEPDRIAERLEKAPLPALRMERLDLGSGRLLVDCYNANPRSVEAALSTLRDLAGVAGGPSFAVLGDMRELGPASAELHHKIGLAAAGSGLSGLCTFGSEAGAIAGGAREGDLDPVLETESIDEATDWSRERLRAGGWVLIKGSRAMRMERIAETIAEEYGVSWRKG